MKMDGAKAATETLDARKSCGRQARWQGRSFPVRGSGPDSDENPGGSRI